MPQRLGVDSYSLRWQGWDAFQLLEYAARIGLDNVHFSERHNLASLDAGYLRELKTRSSELGVAIEIGMGSFDRFARSFVAANGTGEEQLSDMLRAAAICGSLVVRCFLGAHTERAGPISIDDHLQECLRVLRSVAPLARDVGVKVAVENHGGVDLLARELRWLVEQAGPDAVGVCLDTGNPAYGGEDPLLTAEILAPYTVSSHVRDTAIWATEDGAAAQWVPMGEGNVDLSAILRLLAEQAPTCPVDLEVITGTLPKPIPYLNARAEYWRMYPNMPAPDFARFVALAQDGRRRGLGPRDQLIAPLGPWNPNGEYSEVLREQQLQDFETSVHYARWALGLGQH